MVGYNPLQYDKEKFTNAATWTWNLPEKITLFSNKGACFGDIIFLPDDIYIYLFKRPLWTKYVYKLYIFHYFIF